MSGYWRSDGSVTKESYGKLGSIGAVKWASNSLATDVNDMHNRLVTESAFFERFAGWRTPMLEFLPKFVVLDFMLLATRHGRLAASRSHSPVERVGLSTSRWCASSIDSCWNSFRGTGSAGDSRVAGDLQAFAAGGSERAALFSKQDRRDWTSVLQGFKDADGVGGRPFRRDGIDSRVKAMLRYYYVLRNMEPPGSGQTTDWDHIIPQSAFDGEDEALARQQHRAYNIAMLPSSKNRRKRDQLLQDFSGPDQAVMATTIAKYEEDPQDFVRQVLVASVN